MEATHLAWGPTKEGVRDAHGTRPQHPQGIFCTARLLHPWDWEEGATCSSLDVPRKVPHRWCIQDTEPVTWYCGCVAQAVRGYDLVAALEWAAEVCVCVCVSDLDWEDTRMTSRPSYMFNSVSTRIFHNLKKKTTLFFSWVRFTQKCHLAHIHC